MLAPKPPQSVAPSPSPLEPGISPAPEAALPAATPRTRRPLDLGKLLARLDGLNSLLVLTLAFLIASFAVRNADFWGHLATGRLLAHGQSSFFGSNPFTWTGEPAVNHSWLFDLFVYLLHALAPTGTVLVIGKALAIALLAAVLLAAGKRGRSLGPATLCVTLAILALAPQLTFRPLLASFLFLAVTLWLLLRQADDSISRRLPWLLAALFAVWVNLDAWFFLGPICVALVLIGEWLQRKLEPASAPPPERLRQLSLALGLGLVGCLLCPDTVNPHRPLAQFAVPAEFMIGLPPETTTDAYFRNLYQSPTRGDYFLNSQTDINTPVLQRFHPPGIAFLLLAGLGLLSFVLNLAELRWAAVLLFTVFLILALWHTSLIGFFAVAAAPLVAQNLAALIVRAQRRWRTAETGLPPEPDDPLLPITSGGRFGLAFSRVLGLLILVGLLALTWPGWLHVRPSLPQFDRRVAWSLDPDPALVRLAAQFAEWHRAGALPPDERGFNLDPDVAGYLAWYCPGEKVFSDGRPETGSVFADLLTVREAFDELGRGIPDQAKLDDARHRLAERGVTHLIFYSVVYEPTLLVTVKFSPNRAWFPWYYNGRAVVLGWDDPKRPAVVAAATKLHFDPVRRAFGPGADEPVPPPPPALQRQQDLEQRRTSPELFHYLYGAPRPPLEADEARADLDYFEMLDRLAYLQAAQYFTAISEGKQLRKQFFARWAGLLLGNAPPGNSQWLMFMLARGTILPLMNLAQNRYYQQQIGTQRLAFAVLAYRAARRAIAAQHTDPDAYLALSQAANMAVPIALVNRAPPPLVQQFTVVQAQTAAQQALARLAVAGRTLRSDFRRYHINPYLTLFSLQNDERQYDLALQDMKAVVDALDMVSDPDEQTNQLRKFCEAQLKRLSRQVADLDEQWLKATESSTPVGKADLAARGGLPARAAKILRDLKEKDVDRLGGDGLLLYLRLQISALGQAEEARAVMDYLDQKRGAMTGDPRFRALELPAAIADNDTAAAGRLLDEQLQGPEDRALREKLAGDLIDNVVLAELGLGVGALSRSMLFYRALRLAYTAAGPADVGAVYRTHAYLDNLAQVLVLRGLLFLFDGDNARARETFQSVVRFQESGVRSDATRFADEYLRALGK